MGCPLLDQLTHRSFDDGGIHVVELEIIEEMRGPGGAVHGGLVASLVDRAGAYAIARDSGHAVATSNLTLSFLASATGGPLRGGNDPPGRPAAGCRRGKGLRRRPRRPPHRERCGDAQLPD
jgi:uncharacterized protein (TIGR00369 family)